MPQTQPLEPSQSAQVCPPPGNCEIFWAPQFEGQNSTRNERKTAMQGIETCRLYLWRRDTSQLTLFHLHRTGLPSAQSSVLVEMLQLMDAILRGARTRSVSLPDLEKLSWSLTKTVNRLGLNKFPRARLTVNSRLGNFRFLPQSRDQRRPRGN